MLAADGRQAAREEAAHAVREHVARRGGLGALDAHVADDERVEDRLREHRGETAAVSAAVSAVSRTSGSLGFRRPAHIISMPNTNNANNAASTMATSGVRCFNMCPV